MEETLKNVKEEKINWEKKIKEAENRVFHQGKLLEKIEDDEGFQTT
jgi:hypothetical protein